MKKESKVYKKLEILAKNAPVGSYAAGCHANIPAACYEYCQGFH